MRGTSASGAGHVRPLHVNRGADIERAYILMMNVISKIIYIMKGMFVLCGKPVGLDGKLQYFCFSLPQGAMLIR